MAKKKGGKKGGVTNTVSQATKSASITDSINTEVIAQALSSVNQPVLLKLCRLCESKDGPFLNIFEADKVIAKKIDDLLPFGIEENDELPHKICFRCSAKVEELYEFVQKCIRTQQSLRKAIGVVGPLATKTINRTLWEEKLNRSNISNDDICNALIKKAMEGIKDIPIDPTPIEKNEEPPSYKEIKNGGPSKEKETGSKKEIDLKKKEPELPTKQSKVEVEKIDQKIATTKTTSSNVEPLNESVSLRSKETRQSVLGNQKDDTSVSKPESGTKRKATQLEESPEPEVQKEKEKPVENSDDKKSFNIMDHISMIKVTGVGVLFQCKLCNRNFLKKDIVMSHACAKNGGPKQEAVPNYVPPPPPPKLTTVKYINTKTDSLPSKPAIVNNKPIVLDDEQAPPAPTKRKPKAGPASKVKRDNSNSETDDSNSSTSIKVIPNPSSKSEAPTVQFPNVPSLNSRYKLVPGPNNTFTLVEEKVSDSTLCLSSDDSNSEGHKIDSEKKQVESKSKQSESSTSSKKHKTNTNSTQQKLPEKKDVPPEKPYPVGLIKKVGHHSNDFAQHISEPMAFTTPAMKKQSYTIVQTGNPSKLLISTKPQQVSDEIPKKKARKGRHDVKDANEQPFSVTLEDATPPKDPGFFTFINVDPLLQPSYVLPTDNIIQESQISTSTPINNSVVVQNKDKDVNKYTCNMCGESFSREKKLLTHIHSHYNKMDEEDQLRQKTKKRTRKS
ncbi:uncharacterized protein [Epargyreus clarus]|uniref:uncharacterized protein n=1 Tax=Epargyreus clarus TaxID=520877 RepID=UPI003C2BBC4F